MATTTGTVLCIQIMRAILSCMDSQGAISIQSYEAPCSVFNDDATLILIALQTNKVSSGVFHHNGAIIFQLDCLTFLLGDPHSVRVLGMSGRIELYGVRMVFNVLQVSA